MAFLITSWHTVSALFLGHLLLPLALFFFQSGLSHELPVHPHSLLLSLLNNGFIATWIPGTCVWQHRHKEFKVKKYSLPRLGGSSSMLISMSASNIHNELYYSWCPNPAPWSAGQLKLQRPTQITEAVCHRAEIWTKMPPS